MADPPRVDLWLARDPQIRDPELLERLSKVLSDDERARVAGMRFEAGRHQQLITRAMVRDVLSNYLPDVSPAEWRFDRGEHGRPVVSREMPDAARAWHFNLAHTAGMVVLAVGRALKFGVDVERTDQRVRLPVARRYFSAAEADALDALPADEQQRRFQRLWTLKEAWLKALGSGIAGGLGSMTFHFQNDVPRFECGADPGASSWVFREFEIDDGYRVALACFAADAPEVALRDYLPVR